MNVPESYSRALEQGTLILQRPSSFLSLGNDEDDSGPVFLARRIRRREFAVRLSILTEEPRRVFLVTVCLEVNKTDINPLKQSCFGQCVCSVLKVDFADFSFCHQLECCHLATNSL